jgi:hypothetical protein
MMTTLVAWLAYPESRRPSALYLGSDSRIAWGFAQSRWDAGRKLFTTSNAPHVFGYCGDVVFPSLVLAQVISAIEQRLLFGERESPEGRHAAVGSLIRSSFEHRHKAPDESFTILHAYRHKLRNSASFSLWRIDYNRATRAWSDSALKLPTPGDIVALGSGAPAIGRAVKDWVKSDVGAVSRSVFSALCDTLKRGKDPHSGGPPQLAALYSFGPAREVGVIYNSNRYLHGLLLPNDLFPSKIGWRNELFESVDAAGRPMPGARRFARPKTTN